MSLGRVVAIVPAYRRGGRDRGRRGRDPRLRPDDRRRRDRRRLAGRHGRRRRAARAPTSSGCRSTSGSAPPCRPGFRFALEHGYDTAVRLDGDGQHDPAELPKLLARARAGRGATSSPARASSTATATTGHRSRGGSASPGSRASSRSSRGRSVTDTTSGFQALNRRGIALFARDYPSDYPEVEATAARAPLPAAAGRGAGDDARARARLLVDHARCARSTTCSR